jgi:hypothetical protein
MRKNCTTSEEIEVPDNETDSGHKADIILMITEPLWFLSELQVED